MDMFLFIRKINIEYQYVTNGQIQEVAFFAF